MPTTHYEPVRMQFEKLGQCPICGWNRSRRRTFEHTVNPFNRTPDGTPKTRSQVREDVIAEADKWQPDFTCTKHKEN